MKTLLPMLCLLVACGPDEAWVGGGDPLDSETEEQPLVLGLAGERSRLDVAQWNIEWLGSVQNGPTDEALQVQKAGELMRSANVDLWAVQEISSQAAFDSLVARLPGYGGLAASDPRYYRADEQRPAIVYKTRALKVRASRLILTDHLFEFAGRPPLEVDLTASIFGRTLDFTAIVVHLKAGATADDWARRVQSSVALKAHADGLTGPVLIIGDFNDQMTGSNARGHESPFAPWVADTARYDVLTLPLEDAGKPSSVFGSFIDHAIATGLQHRASSVHDPRPFLPKYAETTSDHFPVLHLFDLR